MWLPPNSRSHAPVAALGGQLFFSLLFLSVALTFCPHFHLPDTVPGKHVVYSENQAAVQEHPVAAGCSHHLPRGFENG